VADTTDLQAFIQTIQEFEREIDFIRNSQKIQRAEVKALQAAVFEMSSLIPDWVLTLSSETVDIIITAALNGHGK
jgi:predicted Zn-dependent protease